jgi:hypothetical protein
LLSDRREDARGASDIDYSSRRFLFRAGLQGLIWNGARVSDKLEHALPTSPSPREGNASGATRYIAVSFRRVGNGFAPGPAVECPDATLAVQRAELMTREEDLAGAVAFSRTGDPVSKEVGAAVILKSFGEIPDDFDIA